MMHPGGRKCDYYEGKRYLEIRRGQMTAWVDKFLSGPHVADARQFILCTTFNAFEIPELVSEWKACARRLADHEVNADLWDGTKVHSLLRHRRDVVAELFGDQVASRFCVGASDQPPDPSATSFLGQHMSRSGRSLTVQNTSIWCDVQLPVDQGMSTGATLQFARSELSSISISVVGSEFVRWMHWRNSAPHDASRPYAAAAADGTGRYALMAGAARLMLTSEEVRHLDWILRVAWDAFHDCAKRQLALYRACGFRRLLGSSGPFVLASVDRALWRAMLDFAEAHDTDSGAGDWHIFDAAPGCLKVYTSRTTRTLDRGYHAILFAYNTDGTWLPWERSVVIGWEPPAAQEGEGPISSRGWWDAQFTHDWLMQELLPQVVRWAQSAPGSQNYLDAEPESFSDTDLDQACSLASALTARDLPTDRQGLYGCVERLQAHFNGRHSQVQIPATVAQAVLWAIDRALCFATLVHEEYFRSVMRVRDEADVALAIRDRARIHVDPVTSSTLDHWLRGLLEVMRSASSAPSMEWRSLASTLQPVLDCYHEDVLCDLFTTEHRI